MNLLAIFLVFSMVCYGLSNIVVFSYGPFNIIAKIRNGISSLHPQLRELLSCMICFPFWAGVFLSFLSCLIGTHLAPFNYLMAPKSSIMFALSIILDGVTSSGSTWILHNIEEWFERK